MGLQPSVGCAQCKPGDKRRVASLEARHARSVTLEEIVSSGAEAQFKTTADVGAKSPDLLKNAMLRAGARGNLCRTSPQGRGKLALREDGIAASRTRAKARLACACASRSLKAPLPRLEVGGFHQLRREIHRSQKARGDGAAVLSSRPGARPRKYFWMRRTKGRAQEKAGSLRSE